METLFMEEKNIKQAGVPADLNASSLTGARVNLSSGDRLAIVVSMGDSTAAVTDFTLRQHDAASAGNSKDLEITNPYFTKVGSDTTFTKNEISTATANIVPTVFAGDEGVVVFEVLSEDLDVNNGFAWVSLNIADPTAAKIFAAVYVVGKNRYLPAYKNEI